MKGKNSAGDDAAAGEGAEVVKSKEAEADQQGAFNEETGEINWDCPVRRSLLYSTAFARVSSSVDHRLSRMAPRSSLVAHVQCLGGMADGPCGEQFKSAFSCFVFSEAEPKGMDCVEKFKMMQDCFREHPDIYGEGEWTFSTLSCLVCSVGWHVGRFR